MPEPQRKSLAEHTQFVRELCDLSLYFAVCWHREHPDEALSHTLRQRTPLFLHALDISPGEVPDGSPAHALLLAADDPANARLDPQTFANRLLPIVADFIEERAPITYPTSVGMGVPPSWNVRSLKYDPPRDDVPRNQCNFHISNYLAPRSILADPRHLPECFIELMDRSGAEYGFDSLRTMTWLNDEPRWLALFPREWHENMGAPHPETFNNWGFWGQVVNARGLLNHKQAAYVRAYGRLCYRTRPSHCTFAAMRAHLEELLRGLA